MVLVLLGTCNDCILICQWIKKKKKKVGAAKALQKLTDLTGAMRILLGKVSMVITYAATRLMFNDMCELMCDLRVIPPQGLSVYENTDFL